MFAGVRPGNCQISVNWVLKISSSGTLAEMDGELLTVEPLQNE